jgi:hypothetical protein
MFDIQQYSQELQLRDGIYFSKSDRRISYPEEGNQHCFQLEDSSFWFEHRNNCIQACIQKYTNAKVFFDIGGGNGFVSRALQQQGINTVLVEPGYQGCLNAQKRGLQNMICSTLEDASFYPNSIPAIGLFDVVEHIEADLSFLKSIHTLLQTQGHVFISVPAYQALWSKEDDDAGHFRRYTRANLEQKLRDAGFEIVYSTYIFSLLILPVFLFRTIPSRLGLHHNAGQSATHQKEHAKPGGLSQQVLNAIWRFELKKIQQGRSLPFGGSVLVVARKK